MFVNTINNYSDTEKLFPILEKVITQQIEIIDQQKEEIQYLRTQLAKALETKK